MSTHPLRLLVSLSIIACALTATGCGTATVQGDELEKKISDSLEQRAGQRPDAIECPPEVEAKKGTKARCTIVGSDGSEIGMAVTMTNDKGAFDYEVDQTVSKPPAKK